MTHQGPVGHLDADCFYVSAERVRNGFLAGIPVGVLGNQGACVIAKSYEMKRMGVGTGMPIWEALVKCPGGVYVKRDFRWYEVLSRLMLGIVQDLSGRTEYYSIDEFFFDATPPRGLDPQAYAEKIRDRVMDEVGVPVTVGIARSKTLAKLISDAAKPYGALAVLDADAERRLLGSRPVSEITGIAGNRERTLAAWNIRTCLDLANADRGLVRELLTATGEALWWELRGDPARAILTRRPIHKAISRGGSFGDRTSSPSVIFAWLVRNMERLIEELRYHETLAGRLAVWVGYEGKVAGSGRAEMAVPTDRFDSLLDVGRTCLRRAYLPRMPAMRMHIFAEHLRHRRDGQRGFFEAADGTRAEAIAKVKHEINARHGRFALRSGATLPLKAIYDDRASGYDICDVRGKMCF